MDTYADDLAELMESLDLKDAMLVGHSSGGAVVARYIGRHGTNRAAKVVRIGSVTPLVLKTPENPDGIPIEVLVDSGRRSLPTVPNSSKTWRSPISGHQYRPRRDLVWKATSGKLVLEQDNRLCRKR